MGARNLRLVDMTMDVRQPFAESDRPSGTIAPAVPVALWALDNSNDTWLQLIGYTHAQMTQAFYDGPPAVTHDFESVPWSGVGHGLCITQDSTAIVAMSEGIPDPVSNDYERWTIHPNAARDFGMVSPLVRRISTEQLGMVSPRGARSALELLTGEIVFSRGALIMIERAQLLTDEAWPMRHVETRDSNGLAWDTCLDAAGNVWMAGGDKIWQLTPAQLRQGGIQPATKVMQGSNVSASADVDLGIGGIAFHAGRMFAFDYTSNSLKRWSAAVVSALTSVASNPAPEVTMTYSAVDHGEGWGVVCDGDGGAWISTVDARFGKLLYFTPAQVSAGGTQVPERVIVTPHNWMGLVRLAPGYGPRR